MYKILRTKESSTIVETANEFEQTSYCSSSWRPVDPCTYVVHCRISSAICCWSVDEFQRLLLFQHGRMDYEVGVASSGDRTVPQALINSEDWTQAKQYLA